MLRLLAAILVFLSFACREAPEPGATQFVVSDSAGVEIVQNGTVGAFADGLLDLREELRLGVVEGEEHLQFAGVGPVAVDAQGTLYVADLRSAEIRVFSHDGEYRRAIGQEGDGPGEFRTISDIIVFGDTILVVDRAQIRATFFRRDGEFLDDTRLAAGARGLIPLGPAADAIIVQVAGAPAGFRHEVGIARRDTTRIAAVQSLSEGVRSLGSGEAGALRELTAYPGGRTFGIEAGDALTAGSPLWESEATHAVDGSGRVFISRGLPYQIDVYDATGNLSRSIRRAHTPVPVTAELSERFRSEAGTYFDTATHRIAERELVRASEEGRATLPRVDAVPALGDLMVSRGGSIWVERPDLVEDPVMLEWTRGGVPESYWDIFDATGRFLGTVRLPERFAPRGVTDDLAVVGVERDALDVEYIVRYAIADQ